MIFGYRAVAADGVAGVFSQGQAAGIQVIELKGRAVYLSPSAGGTEGAEGVRFDRGAAAAVDAPQPLLEGRAGLREALQRLAHGPEVVSREEARLAGGPVALAADQHGVIDASGHFSSFLKCVRIFYDILDLHSQIVA